MSQPEKPTVDETAPRAEPKKRRPYRAPEVVTRPLFERMALGCQNPELGDPY